MKKICLFLMAAAFAVVSISCTSDDDELIVIVRTMPSNQAVNDTLSASEQTENKDSIDIPHEVSVRQTETGAPETEVSYHCSLNLNVRLLVDGDTSTDISGTNVTVTRIDMKVHIDDCDSLEMSEIGINSEIMEPLNKCLWSELPIGVRYNYKPLFAEPISIEYKNNFDIEVTTHYVLRTRDSELVSRCETIIDSSVFNYSSDAHREYWYLYLHATIGLSTIQFGAIVADEETENFETTVADSE